MPFSLSNVDLALPTGAGWLPVTFGERPGPAGGLRVAAEAEPEICLRKIQVMPGIR